MDYANQPPEFPECVTILTERKFHDPLEADSCRANVEALKADLEQWADREADSVNLDARQKADQAIDRFNCYARGGKLCF